VSPSARIAGVLITLTMGCSSSTTPAPAPTSEAQPAPSGTTDASSETVPKASDPRCSPHDVSSFEPIWKPPAPRQHVCTEEQLVAITPCALGYGTEEQCARFLPGGPAVDTACTKCVVSGVRDPTWGATVHTADKRIFLNDAGCIALLEPDREQCAKDKQAAKDCVDAACYATCLSDPKISEADHLACSNAAALEGCQSYVERSTVCRLSLMQAQSPASACLVDFDEAGFRTVARIFCGT
jgi:hypothetical protein